MKARVEQQVQASREGLDAFMDDARRILPYFKPYKGRWILLFLVANLYTAMALIDPLLMKFVIDEAILKGDLYLLNLSMLAFVVISAASLTLGYYSSVLYERISQHILFDIRTEMYDHLQELDVLFYDKWKLGDLLSRLNTDISSIENFLSLVYDDLLINILKIVIIFGIIAFLSWEFAIVAVFILPFMVLVQKHYGHVMRTKYRTIREASADLLSFFGERLSTMRLVKVFGREDTESEHQRDKGKQLIHLNVDYVATRQIAEALTGLLTFAVMLFVLWYGGYKVATNQLSIGSLIAIYTYIGRLFGPVRTLTDINISLQTTIASARRVFEILDINTRVKENDDAEPLPTVNGEIIFDNVSFSYADKPVFKDLNLHIDPGETVGIVGSSGAGKTTLAHLLFRFFDPDTGTISIDGYNLKDVTLNSLRSQIGIVEQDQLFFHTSIRENLLYANPDASQADLVEAAKQAGIHDVITALPDGYDTDIGERGAELSRGERQRLALARVFLKNPPIVVFDEATSSLDPESEEHVERSLRDLAQDKTMLIIAHRLDTMAFVDRLIVLDDDGLAETGTFTELKEEKGAFWDLYNTRLTK